MQWNFSGHPCWRAQLHQAEGSSAKDGKAAVCAASEGFILVTAEVLDHEELKQLPTTAQPQAHYCFTPPAKEGCWLLFLSESP